MVPSFRFVSRAWEASLSHAFLPHNTHLRYPTKYSYTTKYLPYGRYFLSDINSIRDPTYGVVTRTLQPPPQDSISFSFLPGFTDPYYHLPLLLPASQSLSPSPSTLCPPLTTQLHLCDHLQSPTSNLLTFLKPPLQRHTTTVPSVCNHGEHSAHSWRAYSYLPKLSTANGRHDRPSQRPSPTRRM